MPKMNLWALYMPQHHPDAAVIVPPRSSAVLSKAAETAPTPRDRHLQAIAEHGRMGWQKACGYSWRTLVEMVRSQMTNSASSATAGSG